VYVQTVGYDDFLGL